MPHHNPPEDALGTGGAALVTGGAVRLGAALVRVLAARGMAVAVHHILR